jgi:hypothetical protein
MDAYMDALVDAYCARTLHERIRLLALAELLRPRPIDLVGCAS